MTHLGIDLGTASLKLLLASSQWPERVWAEGYEVRAPRAGYAETEPSDWLAALRAAASRLPQATIDSIGLCGQMHGVVPCSRKRGALHPAILWADQRGKEVLGRLAALGPEVPRRVRNSWASGMAIATILWIKENMPSLYSDSELFLSPKDYLRWAMTGEVGTDYSDASGTLLYDLGSRTWMFDVMERLGLDPAKLPPILESAALAGRVSPEGARLTGLPAGVGVAVGAADTAAAVLGSRLPVGDSIQISIGSGSQILRLSSELPDFHPALNLFESAQPGVYYRMAGMLNGGVALEWVRKTVGVDWAEFYAMADQESAPMDLVFLPYLAGERTPYLNPDARASWIGLGLHHHAVDLVHAALIGVACTVRLGLATLGTAGVSHFRVVGGSSRYAYWNQMLANVLKLPLAVSTQGDMSARGAALLGAQALGAELDFPEEFLVYEPRAWEGIDAYYQRFLDLYARTNP